MRFLFASPYLVIFKMSIFGLKDMNDVSGGSFFWSFFVLSFLKTLWRSQTVFSWLLQKRCFPVTLETSLDHTVYFLNCDFFGSTESVLHFPMCFSLSLNRASSDTTVHASKDPGIQCSPVMWMTCKVIENARFNYL